MATFREAETTLTITLNGGNRWVRYLCLDLGRGVEFGLEMSREPEGQGDDSQGRIGKTAGGKNRTAGDEEIRHVMHPAIGIDHAVPGVVMHPGGAQEVMRAVKSPGLGAGSFFYRDESADTGGGQFLAENLLRLADAAQIQLVPAPEHLEFFAGRRHRFAPVT